MAHRTSGQSCRHKVSHSTETRALQALYDVQRKRADDGPRESRVYECNARGGGHWHLTSRPIGAQGETGRYIATLERTIVFLLAEIERRDRGEMAE